MSAPGWTSHGHPIPGLVGEPPDRPMAVARCGGPPLCSKCAREAAAQQADAGMAFDLAAFEPTPYAGRALFRAYVAQRDLAALRRGRQDGVRVVAEISRDGGTTWVQHWQGFGRSTDEALGALVAAMGADLAQRIGAT